MAALQKMSLSRHFLASCMRKSAVWMPIRTVTNRPMNTVVLFVPQQEAWVVERMGKFYKVLNPGLNFLIPILDSIRYVQSLKEIAIDIPEQSAITNDNVTLRIDGVLYLRVVDAYKASYGVEDPEYAVTQLAQTTMRSEIGKISLDHVFKERESLNVQIVEVINQAAEQPWGIKCLRYEIKDIELPNKVREAMQMQVEAERKKRAVVLESEGLRESAINVAEGKKRAQILESEAVKMQQINIARGDASAILARANASSDGIKMLSNALSKQHGGNAASYNIAEQYVTAFKSLAKTNNTILLPTNTGDVTSMVASAMAVYKNLSIPPKDGELPVSAEEIKEIATAVQKAADSENSSQELAEQLSDNVNTQLEKRDRMQFGMHEKTLL